MNSALGLEFHGIHWSTYIFVRQDLSKIFELFYPSFQQSSETNDTSFESPNIELLKSRKKLGMAYPEGGHALLTEKALPLQKFI